MKENSSEFNASFFIAFISAITICLYPILAAYKFVASFSIGLTLMIIVGFLCVIYSRKIFFNVPFLILLGIHSILSIVAYFYINDKTGTESIIWSIIMTFISSIALMQIVPFYQEQIMLRVLIPISLIVSIFLVYQLFVIMTGEVPYNGRLFTELSNGYTWSASVTYMRPNSFLSEPSYYAIYMFPILAMLLKNKHYFLSIFLFITLILSTSSLGIVGGFLILLIYSLVNKSILKFGSILLGIVLLLIVVIDLFNLHWLLNFNLNKIMNLQDNSGIRLTGYIDYFSLLPLFNQIIGVGFGQLANYFNSFNLANYSNAFVLILINFGIIGLISYVLYFLFSIVNEKKEGYIFIFILFVISCVDAFIYSANFFYILYFIFIFLKRGTKSIRI